MKFIDIEEEVKELIDCHGEGDYLDFKDDIDNIFEDSIYEENDKIIIKVDFKK